MPVWRDMPARARVRSSQPHPTLPAGRGNACLAPLQASATDPLLKDVSRSFYLSLRLLPRPMRRAAGLAYLLARTSDTLADSASAPAAVRLDSLDQFSASITGGEAPDWSDEMVRGIDDPAERQLLAATPALLENLGHLPVAEVDLIREVVGIIIGGQRLDLQRFGHATGECPLALPDEAALDDYTWRVAGCVGAFWTRLGHLTLGPGFSKQAHETLVQQAIRYGKGLQLVNILRDLSADLAHGRCYLPVPDPGDKTVLLAAHKQWLQHARSHVAEGFAYAAALSSRRLRAASVLPAMIARDTLDMLESAGAAVLDRRIKVPRSTVYRSLARAFLSRPAA